MRTTVTLDSDVEALLRCAIRQRGESFKEVLNTAIRDGLQPAKRIKPGPFKQKTFGLGGVSRGINFDKALALADALEDAEQVRRLKLGK
jgi:hypothetical protein